MSGLTKISFGVQVALEFMRRDKSMSSRKALPLAGQTVLAFLADERIEFGDRRYDWTPAAAVQIATEYETRHWDNAS